MAGNERDRALDPTVAELIDRKKKKPRQQPRYPSEEKRVKATWDLSPELLQRVREMAAELDVAQYALVEKLLREGLDRVESGDLELVRVAQVVTYGLE